MSEKVIEQKHCRQCQTGFEITDKDIEFYEKISPVFSGKKYQIPNPTLCPSCRQQRRCTFRNERSLYKRKCDLSNKDIISIYSPDKPYTVYEQKEWRSNSRSPLDYATDFDFNKGFFEQFDTLFKRVPLMSLVGQSNENCDFTFDNNFSKNCYMSVVVDDGENVLYSNRVFNKCKDIVDAYFVFNTSSLVYDSLYINNCHNIKHCFTCNDSTSLILCQLCNNCEECIGCKNLTGNKYHIFNKPYSREEYLKQKEDLDLITIKEKSNILFATLPVKANTFVNVENCQGGNLTNCTNCYYCFNTEDSKDVRYAAYSAGIVDCYDVEDTCYNVSLSYENHTVIKNNNHILFSLFMMEGNAKCFYSTLLTGCNNCFGCIGLRNASYCILNKQYSKENYEKLVTQVIERMDTQGERGEFFPSTISPFGYNETVAQEYFPLPKGIAQDRGYKRNMYETPFPKVEKSLMGDEIGNIAEISDEILKQTITCEITGRPFKIVKQELDFYRSNNIPLPHKHPDVRHTERMKLRNPMKLWKRACAKCGITIQTSYAPERKEIVYCEACYNKEIYG